MTLENVRFSLVFNASEAKEEESSGINCTGGQRLSAERRNKRIVTQSRILAIGTIGIFLAYSGLAYLQSSLNFDDSIGTTSLAIGYATGIFCNVTFAPFLFHVFGAKTLLLVSEFCMTVYTIANLYPVKYIMYPGAFFLGVGQALTWPAVAMFNTHFGACFVSCRRNSRSSEYGNDKDLCSNLNSETLKWEKTRWFTGRFFALFSLHQIIGNIAAYGVFFMDAEPDSPLPENVSLSTVTPEPTNFSCGSKDCYEYSFENERHVKLDVNNETLKYILFAIYGLVQLLSLIIHKVYLESFQLKAREEKPLPKISVVHLTQILRHMISPLQLSLAPLNIYMGMAMAFCFGDLTRSYISCTIGVKQVGLVMSMFGMYGALGSLSFQYFSARIGRNGFLTIFAFLEIPLLLFTILWEQTIGSSSWKTYILVACFGLPDSILQAFVNATYPEYFPGKENVAFSCMPLFTSTGFVIMFVVGTNICVLPKIILLLSMLVLSLVLYTCGEVFRVRRLNES